MGEGIWVDPEGAEEEERNTAVVVLGLMAEEAEAEEDTNQTTKDMRQEEMAEMEAHMEAEEVQEEFLIIIPMEALGKTALTPEGRALLTLPMEEAEEDTAKQGRREPAPKVEREEVA